MNFKDLIDAEMAEYRDAAYADHGSARDQLERFAEAVAKLEREACAKLCETAEVPIDIDVWMGTKKALTAATAIGMATAIRKRSNAKIRDGEAVPLD